MSRNNIIALIFAMGLLACQPGVKKNPASSDATQEKEVIEITYKVEGMTCDHCEMSIQKGVGELSGIESVLANYEDSTTIVRFDKSKTDNEEIKKAIEKRGYQVKGGI